VTSLHFGLDLMGLFNKAFIDKIFASDD